MSFFPSSILQNYRKSLIKITDPAPALGSQIISAPAVQFFSESGTKQSASGTPE